MPLSLVVKDLFATQVGHAVQSGFGKPGLDLIEAMASEKLGRVPVQRVADPDFGVWMHGHTNCRQMYCDAQALHQPPRACHQAPLQTANRGSRPTERL